MPTADVIEGTWEEVLRQADRLAGRRVRLVVMDGGETPPSLGAAFAERVRAWEEWCAAPRPTAAPLTDDAISRESIYSRERD